jgi:hypothetical protein
LSCVMGFVAALGVVVGLLLTAVAPVAARTSAC